MPRKISRVSLICNQCHCSYEVVPSRIPRSHFCSYRCALIFRNTKEKIQLICKYCAAPYEVQPYESATSKFCSRTCKDLSQIGVSHSKESVLSRYWRYVDKQGPEECWPWTGYRIKGGYGMLKISGKDTLAHRFIFQEIYGLLPPKIEVCHTCDNPPCQNYIAHLFKGTHSDNMQDAVQKKRFPAQHVGNLAARKLTNAQALHVRAVKGETPQRLLAIQYGVSIGAISHIQRGHSYKKI